MQLGRWLLPFIFAATAIGEDSIAGSWIVIEGTRFLRGPTFFHGVMIQPNGCPVFFPHRLCPSLNECANFRFIVNSL